MRSRKLMRGGAAVAALTLCSGLLVLVDPAFRGDQQSNGGNLTGAMPSAPHAGAWFPTRFKTLVEHAYPAL